MYAIAHTPQPKPATFPAPPKRFLPEAAILACDSYRSAVRLGWKHRTREHMTQQSLAEECGLYAPHVSNYLNEQSHDRKGNKRHELPPDKIDLFEAAVGNHAVSQYLNRRCELTIMEEVIATRHL